MSPYEFLAERPTLPPLHTLDLPFPISRKPRLAGTSGSELHERQSCQRLHVPRQLPYERRLSMSSSTSSRTPSPTPSESSSGYQSSHSSQSRPTRNSMRLVPSSFDDADAVLVIPPPNAPYVPTSLSSPLPCPAPSSGQALLLTGPSLDHFRQPLRQVAKGARVHPYRIVREGDSSASRRRASAVSAITV